MRKSRFLRERRVVNSLLFVTLFGVTAGMCFDLKSGIILEDLKSVVEEGIVSRFPIEGINVKIGRLQADPFNKFYMNEVNISVQDGLEKSHRSPFISVEKIIVKKRFLSFLSLKDPSQERLFLISPVLYTRFYKSLNLKFGHKDDMRDLDNLDNMSFYVLDGKVIDYKLGTYLSNLSGDIILNGRDFIFKDVEGKICDIPVLLNGTFVFGEENRPPELSFNIDLLTKRFPGRLNVKNLTGENGIYVNGAVKLYNRLYIAFKGKIFVQDRDLLRFEDFIINDKFRLKGIYNLKSKDIRFDIAYGGGRIYLTRRPIDLHRYKFKTKISHIKLFDMDVVSNIETVISFMEKGYSGIMCTLRTNKLIVNYKPFDDIRMKINLEEDFLLLDSLSLGDRYILSGRLGLDRPYNINLSLEIEGADLSEWGAFSAYSDFISGMMFGKIFIKGPLKNPITEGKIELRDGNIKDIKFDVVNIKIYGEGPVLTITDSRIFKHSGFLLISGLVDLRKLGKRNIFEDLVVETDQRVIVWDGWDVTKDLATSEVNLRKDINEDFRIRFKGYTQKDEEGFRRHSEIGLDYKLEKDDSLNVRMQEDGAFVGVEHRIKF